MPPRPSRRPADAALTTASALSALHPSPDPATAESAVMPRAAIAAGAELVLPLDQIGACLGRMACAARVAT